MEIDLEKIKSKKSIKELLEFSILNIDKPAGMTSFDVVERVQKIFGLRKTSHFGTLDPMVTGVLPVALNRACKLTGDFISHDKTYEGTMKFHKDVKLDDINKMIKEKFLGKIIQKPPVRSRVKRVEREREIYSFEITKEILKGKEFGFITKVQGGTYIRKLVDDLGSAMGINAHMASLRRLDAGLFSEKDKEFITLENLEKIKDNEKELKEKLIPAEIVSKLYEVVQLKEKEVQGVLHGRKIEQDMIEDKIKSKIGDRIAIFCKDRFIGTADVTKGKYIVKAAFTLQPIHG